VLVRQATANVIAKRNGNFSWVFWTAVFINIYTNLATLISWHFRRYVESKYEAMQGTATGEVLLEKSKSSPLEVIRRFMELPWTYWSILLFTLFETPVAVVFANNLAELVEQRFHVSSVKAGLYSSFTSHLDFVIPPLNGIFIDFFGQPLSVLAATGTGIFIAMCLVAFDNGDRVSGTAAGMAIFSGTFAFGVTSFMDLIRTCLPTQNIFGVACAIKLAVDSAAEIILRLVIGVVQDRDRNAYDHAVWVYVALSVTSTAVAWVLLGLCWTMGGLELKCLQWSRRERIKRGTEEVQAHQAEGSAPFGDMLPVLALLVLVFGSWAAYFWGIVTGRGA
jgi:nitrate/nitrite transporter NarK